MSLLLLLPRQHTQPTWVRHLWKRLTNRYVLHIHPCQSSSTTRGGVRKTADGHTCSSAFTRQIRHISSSALRRQIGHTCSSAFTRQIRHISSSSFRRKIGPDRTDHRHPAPEWSTILTHNQYIFTIIYVQHKLNCSCFLVVLYVCSFGSQSEEVRPPALTRLRARTWPNRRYIYYIYSYFQSNLRIIYLII